MPHPKKECNADDASYVPSSDEEGDKLKSPTLSHLASDYSSEEDEEDAEDQDRAVSEPAKEAWEEVGRTLPHVQCDEASVQEEACRFFALSLYRASQLP
jgi:hypothetical protein